MASMFKPIATSPELLDLLEKASSIEFTPEMQRAQRRSWVIGQMLLAHPQMTRDYVVGVLDTIEADRVEQPHEVAETIARAIEPHGGAKARREALAWAAGVARSLYPKPEAGGVE